MEYSLETGKWEEVPTFGPLEAEIVMGKQSGIG